ncbi:C2 family cysteine protease [Streptomyces sp. NPDC088560]|uniref:C2 family cysteine protease n=1 Tax=Streptomyces sp. NPDC088560 TaxID=3365868 RepID=UPI00380DA54B
MKRSLSVQPSPDQISYGGGDWFPHEISSPLFRASGLPEYTDIKQGGLADCWLLATLASVAYADPHYVKAMFRDVGNGRFEVALREKVSVGSVVPHYRCQPDARTAVAKNDEVSWVALTEKAAVKLLQKDDNSQDQFTYAAIDYDVVSRGFELLGLLDHGDVFEMPSRFQRFKSYLGGENHALRSPWSDSDLRYLDKALVRGRAVTVSTSSYAKDDQLSSGHVYALLGKVDRGGMSGYLLYDPRGEEVFIDRNKFSRNIIGFSWSKNLSTAKREKFPELYGNLKSGKSDVYTNKSTRSDMPGGGRIASAASAIILDSQSAALPTAQSAQTESSRQYLSGAPSRPR